MSHRLHFCLATALVMAVCFDASAQSVEKEQEARTPRVHQAVRHAVSEPLRVLVQRQRQQQPRFNDEVVKPYEVPNQLVPERLQGRAPVDTRNDPFTQQNPATRQAPVASLSFEGYSNLDNLALFGGQVAPPDTNGDVSDLHYIQYINLGWTIFDKTDGSIAAGPFAGNVFWNGFGGSCETDNAGDPIVLYDELADRWLFSQFAEPASAGGRQCFAISQTDDPLGPYDLYEFAVPGIDYPKIGIFTDGADHSGYYFTTNNFNPSFSGASLAVIDRDAMIAGDPTATVIEFVETGTAQDGFFAIQPGHLEGGAAPAGSCNVFVQAFDDDVWGSGTRPDDGYMFWLMCPDFATPANTTLDGPLFVSAGAGVDFDAELCGFAECIPQPGTGQLLDTLSQFTMYRASMRVGPGSDPGGIRMVVSHTVDVGANQAGVRWVELDLVSLTDIGTNPPAVLDQGTFAPDGESRWLPSAAMDESGNIGIGYSLGSASTAPSIYFTGREVGDPAGQLQAESVCVDGPGVQTGTNRWVDYSSMSVDPDGCTFWYTSEYYPVTDSFSWSTRVCSFSFPSCGTPRVILSVDSGEPMQQVCAGDSLTNIDLAVSLNTGDTDDVTLGSNAPAGFTVGFTPTVVSPTPGNSLVGIATDGGLAAGVYAFQLTGTAVGFDDGSIDIGVEVFDAAPAQATTLVAPLDGQLDISANPTLSWTAVAETTEYLVEVDDNGDFSSPEFSTLTVDTSVDVTPPLATGVTYNWRVTAMSPCGDAPASAVRTFATAAPAASLVLLVDDDNNAPDVRSFFANALNDVGASFDVFDTGISDATEPDLATLQGYQAVVWFSGDNFNSATGPSPASATALSTYLDGGGCLLLSSADYIWKTFGSAGGTPTTFMQDYLGFDDFTQDTSYTSSTGSAGSPYAALGPYVLSFPPSFTNFSDELVPSAAGAAAFEDAGFPTATYVTGGAFDSLFMGFSFAAVPTAQDREDVMQAFLGDQCGALGNFPAGVLSGTVTSAGSGNGLGGLTVTATRAGVDFVAITDGQGDYQFDDLPTGFYSMAVSGANISPPPAVINVEVVDQATTDQDFVVDAGELVFDASTLIETLLVGDSAANLLSLANPGTLDVDFALAIGSYGVSLPSMAPTSGGVRHTARRTSFGLAEAFTAPEWLRSAAVPAASGDLLGSSPFTAGTSPIGITMSPDGTIWVNDLLSGQTQVYTPELLFAGTINDPLGPRSGVGAAVTSGITYDSTNGTLWWLDAEVPELVEADLSGVATGNTIAVTAPGGLPAGVEYDPATDSFFYLDIADDDIYSIDRAGGVRLGYPVPQTDYDTGAGLLGNGLDVVDGGLEVLVGTIDEGQTSRAVLTDVFGNNTGAETLLAVTGDTFINDVTRSRIDGDGRLYVVGNATSTIYIVEPTSLDLRTQWASVDIVAGTVVAGNSTDVTITHDATDMPFGDFQAQLAASGNFANDPAPKPLGLTVQGSPELVAELTGYVGSDSGAGCLSSSGTALVTAQPAEAVTLCLVVQNLGDTHLADLDGTIQPFAIDLASMTRLAGMATLTPSGSAIYSAVVAAPASQTSVTMDVSAASQDSDGEPVNPDPANALATMQVGPAAAADISLDVSATVASVVAGSDVDFELQVDNAGPDPATGVTVSASVPAGAAYVSGSGSGWTCNLVVSTIDCDQADPIAAAGSAPLLTLTLTASTSGILELEANAGGNELDGNPVNNIDDASIVVDPAPAAAADVSLNVAATAASVLAGSDVDFELQVDNAGPDPATGVTVSADVPASATYVAGSGTGWTCNLLVSTIECDQADPIAASGSAPLLTLTLTATNPGNLELEANVDADELDGDVLNNIADASVTVQPIPSADLAVTIVAGSPVVALRDSVSITAAVANVGSDDETGVQAVFTLPAGFSLNEANGTDWTCGSSGSTVTCDLAGTLQPDIAPALVLVVDVNVGAALGPNSIEVEVSGDLPDANLSNNTASADVDVVQGAPLPDDIFSDGFESGE